MKGKMFKLPNTRTHGNAPKGRFKPGKEPIPVAKRDRISDHLPKVADVKVTLPDKLKGK